MRLVICVLLAASLAACGRGASASLPLGSPAPDFSLPGVDGRTHTLADLAASPVLVVAFTCNHCPASQRLEGELNALVRDEGGRGVAVVAINPDSDAATRDDDLSYSDVGESLDDMKTRAAFAHVTYPYLSDGATQQAARAFRITTTPQVFVFDRARTLRYAGAPGDTRAAVDAVLTGRPAPTAHETTAGCPVLWQSDTARVADERKAIAAGPVSVDAAGPDVLAALRKNGTGGPLLVNFWATWCGPCRMIMPELDRLNTQFHAQGLTVVGLAQEPEGDILRHLARSPVGYTVARDIGHTMSTYGVHAIPMLVVVDRRGHVARVFTGISPGDMTDLAALVQMLVRQSP